MLKRARMPKSDTDLPYAHLYADADPTPTTPVARFGPLALWGAFASALIVGIAGTVAYGAWFNQDQRAYSDAMAGARHALGVQRSTQMMSQTSSSGPVLSPSLPSSSPPSSVAVGAQPDASRLSNRKVGLTPDSNLKHSTEDQIRLVNRPGTQTHRQSATHKAKPSLFARMGYFLRRASYRQHESGSHQDLYSRP